MEFENSYTSNPDNKQREFILKLWNREYPKQLQFVNEKALDGYLKGLLNPWHVFAHHEEYMIAWAFSFEREGQRWFAIIVDSNWHRKGVGKSLLGYLKKREQELNAWVIDHGDDIKLNGQKYVSPLNFYLKNEFRVVPKVRLETEKLSALKIVWKKSTV